MTASLVQTQASARCRTASATALQRSYHCFAPTAGQWDGAAAMI
eukprot:CAMPEP_0179011074 /NCGR_PEP_ID=MMETSP0796-20121207/472_1 /TAXON_ID=73915 /ORGANISM="Pyrodinium bahamense, Strain pbaha01" /LENGTH=43 /DNA_ID= /DNA_START= /DNA_END= /DNA_ORIENTATION=